MTEQYLLAFARLETPGGQGGGMTKRIVEELLRIGVENLGGMEPRQLGAQGFERQFGDGELPGGDIHIGNRGPPLVKDDRGEVVVRVARQESRLDHRPRSHDADNLAREDPLRWLFADLFADGDVVAFFDEAGEVVFDGVVRDARQRDAHAAADGTGGEHDVEFAGGDLGVLVEGLVEIADAEEEDRVGMVAFDLEVLLADGGDVVGGHGGLSF